MSLLEDAQLDTSARSLVREDDRVTGMEVTAPHPGHWIVTPAATPGDHGRVEWNGGQAAFPGGWLELDAADVPVSTGTTSSSSDAQVLSGSASSAVSHSPASTVEVPEGSALVWDPLERAYKATACPFKFTCLSLDRSPETLALADTVEDWIAAAESRGSGPSARTAETDNERDEWGIYISIAQALQDKLGKDEEELKQDYASTIVAIRKDDEVVGVIDYYLRTKSRSLILKYILAHPDSQLPMDERPAGTIGGVWKEGGFRYLMAHARAVSHLRTVKMEALSARLYASAVQLGFKQLGSRIPRVPTFSLVNINDNTI
ncbi:hypothetical protein CYMTET_6955 [Cymbomonas tetramitiformis]|uniref:Uncharacterized protein n=1 Tax=Cymbomonas tetramitiformis TaxID=36881 RepID=A0AAE0GXW7_9CHLO|nr:hypothetical protein CYMTET_6955 [Cymbomonas tetramitiformis]